MLRASMDELMATESDTESEKSKRAVVKAEKANPERAKLCKKAKDSIFPRSITSRTKPDQEKLCKKEGKPKRKKSRARDGGSGR